MNTNSKRFFLGILTMVSAALLVSPVDVLTGMQIDDIIYLATTIFSVANEIKTFTDSKSIKNQEA